ncbi:MAG TPA: ParB/RepB/Spo0J family partition protein [Glaciibacter sp.]|nr:ParB/RepB/Spo0J family partition protein [Glaciibacter sp.]
MADNVLLVAPEEIDRNPENPRLIFRSDELAALEESIKQQGILVPLTLYNTAKGYSILDGERRWRCALRLGMTKVPVIVQPEPSRLQNIMMMFAIHNTRRDWDPLPTALKLAELEEEFSAINERQPTESQLAELASVSRGEVRRLRKLLALPQAYRDELLQELEKPRSEQVLTVDHVLEATKGAASLRNRDVIDDDQEESLRRAIIEKFKTGVIDNTVAPRQLARIARAVERNEVSAATARQVVNRLLKVPRYTIDQAYQDSVERVDFEHGLEQLVNRLAAQLDEHASRGYAVGDGLRESLTRARTAINRLLDE